MRWPNIVTTPELDETVRRYLADSKLSFSTLVREALVEYLAKRGYEVEGSVHPQVGGTRK